MLAERLFTTTMWGPLAVAIAWLTPLPAGARWGVSALALGALATSNPPRRLASGGCEPRPTGPTMTGMTMKECQR